ncbi:hypothetical protein MJO28_006736 [Puccinia striiformis f. sp. tritici]|uniref:Uncharacterized protein n=3 Tax=Puccinia striiformis TaxID=27350 RepID=A0A0L0VL91_9BASI|nr:hypothetical protein MJO28_006736 [Puccinia striiformis f. sp. tritici]KAI7958492.1 hypothetical protein MJO29_006709 [Puccinia striiformis f. sp. tritici]KAI9619523.1 hypothetical protein H4Q26_014288 [Puccinia striiformis f. sp. tritici PST-130]KNF00053.1 hypothetical protein PSTG_06677 [Puccinia striiformis f. sp. tritici PST-78]POV99721.1 hypothetical protein PSTT_13551 [Puccinia striiformis]
MDHIVKLNARHTTAAPAAATGYKPAHIQQAPRSSNLVTSEAWGFCFESAASFFDWGTPIRIAQQFPRTRVRLSFSGFVRNSGYPGRPMMNGMVDTNHDSLPGVRGSCWLFVKLEVRLKRSIDRRPGLRSFAPEAKEKTCPYSQSRLLDEETIGLEFPMPNLPKR